MLQNQNHLYAIKENDGKLEKEKIEVKEDAINILTADEELEENSTPQKSKIIKNSIYDFLWMKKDDLFTDENDLDSIDLLSSIIIYTQKRDTDLRDTPTPLPAYKRGGVF